MTRAQGKHREFSLNQSVATLFDGDGNGVGTCKQDLISGVHMHSIQFNTCSITIVTASSV